MNFHSRTRQTNYFSYIVLVFALCCVFLLVSCSSEEGLTEEEGSETAENDAENGEDENREEENANENADTEDGSSEEEEEVEWEELLSNTAEPPTTLEEVLDYPTGPLAGKTFDEYEEEFKEHLEPLPPLDEEADEEQLEQYWHVLYSLIAENYPGPDTIIRELQFSQFGNPDFEQENMQFHEQFNAQIILDVSGSMAGEIDGKTKMDIAKDSIRSFVETLPEEANVGLRVYGHEGDNTNAGREVSCQSSELVYDMQELNLDEFNDTLDPFEPTGWTPIAYSLEEAMSDFEDYPGEENTNIIYLVTDGIETCDGDPVAAAQELGDSNVQPFLNIIGFDVDAEGQEELQEIAQVTDGMYTNAANEDELTQRLEQSQRLAEQWEEWLDDTASDLHNERFTHALSTIPGFRNTWSDLYGRESRNIQQMKGYLMDHDFITRGQRSDLRDKRHAHRGLMREIATEIREELADINEENYEQAIEEIEELYDEHVDH